MFDPRPLLGSDYRKVIQFLKKWLLFLNSKKKPGQIKEIFLEQRTLEDLKACAESFLFVGVSAFNEKVNDN